MDEQVNNVSIPAKQRWAGREVITKRPPLREITAKGKEGARRIVDKYMELVFTDRIGKMKVRLV